MATLLSVLMASILSISGAAGAGEASGPTVVHIGTSKGAPLPRGFVGIALEASALSTASLGTLAALAPALAGPLSALGPGTIRVGGTSSDYTTLFDDPNHMAPSPAWATAGRITVDDLRALGALISETSPAWTLDLGVNLLHPNPKLVAAEVKAAKAVVGPHLGPVEIGNEPEFFDFQPPNQHLSFAGYLTRWLSLRRAISNAVSGVQFDAADLYDPYWLADSGAAVQSGGYGPLAQYTYHFYPFTDCTKQAVPLSTMLAGASFSAEASQVNMIRAAIGTPALPLSFDEFNSVSCGSYTPAEHEFASALWGLRSMLVAAHSGVAAVDVQTTLDDCSSYTPLCWTESGSGTVSEQPLYFAMELVGSLEGARFLPVHTSGTPLASSVGLFALSEPGQGSSPELIIVNGSRSSLTLGVEDPHTTSVATVNSLSDAQGVEASSNVSLSGPKPCPSCSLSALDIPSYSAEAVALAPS